VHGLKRRLELPVTERFDRPLVHPPSQGWAGFENVPHAAVFVYDDSRILWRRKACFSGPPRCTVGTEQRPLTEGNPIVEDKKPDQISQKNAARWMGIQSNQLVRKMGVSLR